MATYGYDIYQGILYEAAYAGTERAALANLRRFDQDGDSSNGYQISYSFMDTLPDYFANWGIVGFQSPAEDFRQAMRSILGGIDGNTRIDFIEVDDAAYATMRFGLYQTRSGVPAYNTAEAFPPGFYSVNFGSGWTDITGSDGEVTGDALFTPSVINQGIAPGQPGYGTLIHEVLHALGLKHPFGDPGPAMPAQYDNTAYTAMSYTGSFTFTQPAVLDVLALHHLYGTPADVSDDQWVGGYNGTSRDNSFTGGGGRTLNGGEGSDAVTYASSLKGHRLVEGAGGLELRTTSGNQLVNTLLDVEKLQFSDFTVNLTVQKAAAGISPANLKLLEELYVAFFNRVPDADGLEYWIGQLKSGMSVGQIADAFYNAGVQYSALTGYSASMSNADFVNVVYRNVLGRSQGADDEGLAYWSARLDSGAETKGALVQSILGSAHTFKGNATWGWVANLLDNKAMVADTFAVDMGLNYLSPQQSISKGMQIAAAVTPTDTNAAIALIGVNPAQIDLA